MSKKFMGWDEDTVRCILDLYKNIAGSMTRPPKGGHKHVCTLVGKLVGLTEQSIQGTLYTHVEAQRRAPYVDDDDYLLLKEWIMSKSDKSPNPVPCASSEVSPEAVQRFEPVDSEELEEPEVKKKKKKPKKSAKQEESAEPQRVGFLDPELPKFLDAVERRFDQMVEELECIKDQKALLEADNTSLREELVVLRERLHSAESLAVEKQRECETAFMRSMNKKHNIVPSKDV